MKTKYLFVFCIAIAATLFGQGIGEKQSKMARLSKAKMGEVTTGDGFEYFSGYLNTKVIPSNFLTIYSYQNIGEDPKLKIIGRNVNVDFPLSKMDEALSVYKGLVLAKVATDEKELEAIHKSVEKHLQTK